MLETAINPKPAPIVRVTRVQPRLLKTRDAAVYLGISKDTLTDMARSHELAYIEHKPGGPWLFDIRDLDKWIEQHKRQ